MSTVELDTIRGSVLDQMDRQAKMLRLVIVVATILEAGLFTATVAIIDWHDKTQLVVFFMAMLTYLVLALGLIALGIHVSRMTGRVLMALDTRADAL